MHEFQATLKIIDGNPYVDVPDEILSALLVAAEKSTSPIPIHGTLNGKPYRQTLVKFRGAWRLYVNMMMLDDSPRRIGEAVAVTVTYDPSDRTISPHPKLVRALAENEEAQQVFETLSPSLQNEIVRYIAKLKTEQSVNKNVKRAIRFLLGQERFVGREPIKPK
ncbi:MAG: YdeI/OmpD-associated family protein [Ardenticatenaceae bacterium]|nr:YdeI/OmpD-associated family protein [Ardenticatenaceae bacterium]